MLNQKNYKIGVFVNEKIEKIKTIFHQCKLDIVQLHGDEDENFCRELNLPYWKVFRLDKKFSKKEIENFYLQFKDSKAFLLDKYHEEIYGGTGIQIDLEKITPWLKSTKKIILAGGINQNNFNNFLTLKPYCLDISSGIESQEDNRKKSHEKMRKIRELVRKF